MNRRTGFIGCGNMAKAIMRGILSKKLRSPSEIIASDLYENVLAGFQDEAGIATTLDNREAAAGSGILFIAVKPQDYEQTIRGIRDVISSDQIIVTIAPGKTLEWVEGVFGTGRGMRIVRTMPNLPATVGEGVTGICHNPFVTEEDFKAVKELIGSFSDPIEIKESLMDVVCSVSGSSPAIVFMFIEALADAAVLGGMPRQLAYRFAAQTLIGAAHMVKDTGRHPGELKDLVCSPAGTTIEAVRVLEDKGFRGSIIEAVHRCTEKARGL